MLLFLVERDWMALSGVNFPFLTFHRLLWLMFRVCLGHSTNLIQSEREIYFGVFCYTSLLSKVKVVWKLQTKYSEGIIHVLKWITSVSNQQDPHLAFSSPRWNDATDGIWTGRRSLRCSTLVSLWLSSRSDSFSPSSIVLPLPLCLIGCLWYSMNRERDPVGVDPLMHPPVALTLIPFSVKAAHGLSMGCHERQRSTSAKLLR